MNAVHLRWQAGKKKARIHAPVLPRVAPVVVLLAFSGGAACGSQIGDSCALASECSPQGDRICDTSSPGGYCTMQGCSYNTCPEEAVCVRFFAIETGIRCDSGADCGLDEVCTLPPGGMCVPRSAEVRYCMRRCTADIDCRKDYECRDLVRMRSHGGDPVPAPGQDSSSPSPSFCAVAAKPPSS